MAEFNEGKLTTICSEIWYRAISADDGAEVIWDEFAEVQRENAALKERLAKLEGDQEECEWVVDRFGNWQTACGYLFSSTPGIVCEMCHRPIKVSKEAP